MRGVVLALLLVVVLTVFVQKAHASQNGGMGCAGCTLVVGLLEQRAQLTNRTLEEEALRLCTYLPSLISGICVDIVEIVGPILFPIVEDAGSADIACNIATLCKNETAVCRLFPVPKSAPARTEAEYLQAIEDLKAKRFPNGVPQIDVLGMICDRSAVLCSMINRLMAKGLPHLPTFDTDGDRFSDVSTLRGYDWRGKDCNDWDATTFPGRFTSDELVDQNCNGIFGVDTTTSRAYEDEWCNGTGQTGIALLGDSATAHFRIPTEYVTARDWSNTTFEHVLRLLENEGDWPMLSWGTGFLNASEFAPDIHGPMNSLYEYLREQNQCNANDYQNIGVNGARAADLQEWATLLNRNASMTKPIIVFFSMIGNDVCGHSHDFNGMTTPEEYYNSVMAAVMTADSIVPPGSKIILVPLVDGRILFDTMADRIHPIGSTNNDVTYSHFYDYLNCLDVSPCWGWMNSNESVRNGTWKVASSLNAQLPLVVNASIGKVKNVEVFYPGNIIDQRMMNPPVPRWTLIEPVDGFHPSQTGNALIAEAYWQALVNQSLAPPVNPNNAAILSKFGSERR